MKTIKIPKLDPKKSYKVIVNRTMCTENKGGLVVVFKKQQIEGIDIPSIDYFMYGETILAVNNEFSSQPYIYVDGDKLNAIIKSQVIQKLKGII